MRGRAAAGLLAATALAACGDAPVSDDRLPEIDDPQAAESSEGPVETPLQSERGYYAAWGRCLSRTAARLDQSWSRYTVDIDPERHRLRTRGVQPYLDTLESQLESCPLGTQRPESVPEQLATQGRAFVLSARGYNSRAVEMAEYFDSKAYEDDAWADLERLGPALAEAHEEATEAATGFAQVLDVQRDQADRAWLTHLAGESAGEAAGERPAKASRGTAAAWQVTNTTIAARSTSHCLTAVRPLPPLCLKAATAFSTARADLEAYRTAHPAEAIGVFWLEVYTERAAALETALETLRAPPPRRRRGTPPAPPAENAVAKTRAALLSAGDRVVFDFP